MKVEIWSDFMCPFCYMGHNRIQKAIEDFGHQIEVVYRTFQLFPGLKPQIGKNLYESIAELKGANVEDIARVHERLAEAGSSEGLEFNFDRVVPTDTFDALRLSHLAKTKGMQKQFMEAVFKSYFTDALDISDPLTLLQLADSVGIDAQEAEQVLQSDAYAEDVQKDYQTGSDIGVKGVPFFVINNRYAISGAHAPHVFVEILEKARNEDIEDGAGHRCSDCTCGKKHG